MDRINIAGQRDFALSSSSLAFLQDAWTALQAIAGLGGNQNYILSGCEPNGATSVTPGVVVINGEVLPFVGGGVGDNVIVVETPQTVTVGSGTYNKVERHVEFGTRADQIPWASLVHNRFSKPWFSKKIRVTGLPQSGGVGYDIDEILPGKRYTDIKYIRASIGNIRTGNSTECRNIPSENCSWYVNSSTPSTGRMQVLYSSGYTTTNITMDIEIFYE